MLLQLRGFSTELFEILHIQEYLVYVMCPLNHLCRSFFCAYYFDSTVFYKIKTK